jgi:DNA-binding response OmpR family regulator
MENTQKIRILLIDDEKPIAETISAYAEKEQMELLYLSL